MALIASAAATTPDVSSECSDVNTVLEYLDKNYALPITVRELARMSHVSVNTLERHFDRVLHMPPSVYLQKNA